MRAGCGLRLYRALLRLYPAAFRRDYGPLMLAAFEKMCAEAGGGRAQVALCWRVLGDLAASVPAEQLDEKWRWMMGRQLWFVWIVSSVVGWLAAGWFLLPRSPLLMIGVGGALVSALHVPLLQRYVAPPGWWRAALPLKVSGWLLLPALFALLRWQALPWQTLPTALLAPALAAFVVLGAALVGLLEGLALRPLLGTAWRWAPAPVGGLLAGAAAGLLFTYTLLPLAANLAARGTLSFRLSGGILSPMMAREMGLLLPLFMLATALAAAAGYGVVTATMFAWLAGRGGIRFHRQPGEV